MFGTCMDPPGSSTGPLPSFKLCPLSRKVDIFHHISPRFGTSEMLHNSCLRPPEGTPRPDCTQMLLCSTFIFRSRYDPLPCDGLTCSPTMLEAARLDTLFS